MDLTYVLVDLENVQPQDLHLLRGSQFRVLVFHGPHQNKLDVAMVKALQPLGRHVEYVQTEKHGRNALDFHVAFYMGRRVQEHALTDKEGERTARFIVVSRDGGYDALLCHVESLGYGARQAATIREALGLNGANLSGAVAAAMAPTNGGPARLPAPAPPAEPQAAPPAPVQAVPAPAVVKAKAKAQAALPGAQGKASPAPPAKKAGPGAKSAPPRAASDLAKVVENLRAHPNNRPAKRVALERHIQTIFGGKAPASRIQAVVRELERTGAVTFSENKIAYKVSKATK